MQAFHTKSLFMDTIRNVWDEFCSYSNIEKAIRNAAKNKRKYRYVRNVLENIEAYATDLQVRLELGYYTVSEYDAMNVRTHDKVREIRKLPFYPDRIVQHMIANVMHDRWSRSLTDDTYASWKGRGINSKIKRHNLHKKLKAAICSFPLKSELYCLKLDIHKCYQSVDNDLLFETNKHYCGDARLLAIMSLVIYSIEGLPIGSYISQLWINIFLNRLDRYAKEILKIRFYFRYMDDIVIICDDKSLLHEYEHRIMNFCFYELHLEINSKRQIFPIGRVRGERGIDFVGYVYFRTFTLIRKRIKQAFKAKKDNVGSLPSYLGLLRYCDSMNLIRSVLGEEYYQKIKQERMRISQMKIKKIVRPFEGERININDIVDERITILDFEIRDSKKDIGGKYLKMQILFNEKKWFVGGGYKYIIQFLEQLDKDEVCPIERCVIRHDKMGYYIGGTLAV